MLLYIRKPLDRILQIALPVKTKTWKCYRSSEKHFEYKNENGNRKNSYANKKDDGTDLHVFHLDRKNLGDMIDQIGVMSIIFFY